MRYSQLKRCPQPASIKAFYNIAVPDGYGGVRLVKMSPKGGPYRSRPRKVRVRK